MPASTDLALCKAIIVMAHELGMKVIAEGVETAQQRDLLTAAGCDFGPGLRCIHVGPVASAVTGLLLTGCYKNNSYLRIFDEGQGLI